MRDEGGIENLLSSKNWLLNLTKKLLREYGIKPSRRKGQSFSVDPRYINLFSKLLEPIGPQLVLEAGSGLGYITLSLSQTLSSSTIIAVEKDERIYRASLKLLSSRENIIVINADALSIIPRIEDAVLVSSTPFSVSVPIILGAARNNGLKRAVLGVQREVASRITAKPGSRDYGRLTVIASLIFDSRIVECFPPTSFYPKPKVHVCVVELERKNNYNPSLHGRVEQITSCLFSHRNKKALKTIVSCMKGIEDTIGKEHLEKRIGDRRVRQLTPGDIEWLASKAKQ